MSLGITSLWRARPLRPSPSIHGGPLFALPRSAPFRLATCLHYSTLKEDLEALEKGIGNASNHAKKSGAIRKRKTPENGTEAPEKMEKITRKPPKQKQEPDEETLAEIRKIEEALERSNFGNSVFVPRYKDFGTARQRHRSMRIHHKAVTTQVYHERNRVNNDARPVNWRMVLEEMAKSTPELSLEYIEDGIKVDFPKYVLARVLKATGDDAFGAIRRRTGATIKVSCDESTLLLSGTRQAINRATEEFRNIAGKISVTRHYRPLDSGEVEKEELGVEQQFFIPPLSRDEGAHHKEKRITQHVYLTPMPLKWTPKTLEDYVISLVDTYIDPSLHSPIYTPTPNAPLLDHERAVTRRIMRLFRHLPSEVEVSCSVVKLAMSHMTTKGDKYLPYVRSLFVLLDRRGIPLDVDVFNILLRAPVQTRNLRKFRQTIKNMIERGLAPNLDTWLLFLRMFESVEVKSYILHAMNAKNMLGTPEAIQRIAQELAPHDAEHAVIHRKDLATFLKEQEDRYGQDWLTRDAGNKVLHVFGEYERYEDAFKTLDLMGERYHSIPRKHTHERLATRPDAESFAAIINHARVKGKMPLIVNVLRKMKTRKLARQPSSTILRLLFEAAWHARLRTTITVIWRYASLARLTSYRMRQRVAALLSGELGGPEDPEMTADIYHQLGGEALACELVGGREVLEQIKALCRRTWGEKYPREKLGVIATKILALAFEEYGPAVALGTVLSQSVLVDFKCLHAQRAHRLKELLQSAKIKSLPLWQRREEEARWTDLAPLDPSEPATIKHDDVWQDEWESEGWNAKSRVWISEEWRDQFEEAYRIWQAKKAEHVENFASNPESEASQGQANEVKAMQRMFAKALEPLTEKRMAIINPMVWDDEKHDVTATGNDYKTELQKKNEDAMLNALEQFSKDYVSRYIFVDSETTSIESIKGSQGEDPLAGDESDDVGDETMEQDPKIEELLGNIQRLLKKIEGNRREDRPVHGFEEHDRAKSEAKE